MGYGLFNVEIFKFASSRYQFLFSLMLHLKEEIIFKPKMDVNNLLVYSRVALLHKYCK